MDAAAPWVTGEWPAPRRAVPGEQQHPLAQPAGLGYRQGHVRPNFLYVFKATRWRGSRAARPPTRPALGSATAGRPATRPRRNSTADDRKREEAGRTRTTSARPMTRQRQGIGQCAARRWGRSAPWALPTCSARARVGQGQRPLVHIAVRPKACPSCRPAYGPLTMPDPNPNRTPAKAHCAALARVAV